MITRRSRAPQPCRVRVSSPSPPAGLIWPVNDKSARGYLALLREVLFLALALCGSSAAAVAGLGVLCRLDGSLGRNLR